MTLKGERYQRLCVVCRRQVPRDSPYWSDISTTGDQRFWHHECRDKLTPRKTLVVK